MMLQCSSCGRPFDLLTASVLQITTITLSLTIIRKRTGRHVILHTLQRLGKLGPQRSESLFHLLKTKGVNVKTNLVLKCMISSEQRSTIATVQKVLTEVLLWPVDHCGTHGFNFQPGSY